MLRETPSRRSIEEELGHQGLALRRPTLDDMPALFELQRDAFPAYRPEDLMNDQTLYRLIEFGDSVLLHDASGRVLGYHLVFLLNDPERVALSCGLVVHGSLKGRRLGTLMYRHAALRSMVAGARVLRGAVKTTNSPSLGVLLNKMGAVCDRFYARMGASVDFRFRHSLELSEHSLSRSSIDLDRLVELARRSLVDVDYRLVDPGDFEGIEAMYAETEMCVVAVVPAGRLSEGTVLFAVPRKAVERVRAEIEQGDLPWMRS